MDGRNNNNSTEKVTDNIDVSHSQSLMTKHNINSASLAYFKLGRPPEAMVLKMDGSTGDVTEETRYRVASLSKTIFAHLVEKLIDENKSKKDKDWLGKFDLKAAGLNEFNLDTPLYHILPFEGLSGDDVEKAKLITARMVLSHTTGLPGKPGEGPHKLLFNPGEKYSYSNLGFEYLQKVIEKLTNKTLEPLAQTHVFVPYGMTNSTFLPPIGEGGGKPKEIAQNSVHTTPTDYARFAMEMMNPENQHEAFKKSKKSVSMMTDTWAVGQGLGEETLNRILWGNGWAMQLDEHGDPEKAFHWGDYGDAGLNWRAMVVLDLKKNEGMVYMSDSGNGMLLLDQIFNDKTVSLDHGLKFIFEKYGLARENELSNPHWEQEQWDRIGRIIALYEEKIVIHDNKDSNTLSVKCDPLLSNWKSKDITDGIMKELYGFEKKHDLSANDDYKVHIERDGKGNISALSINFSDPKLYDKFISQLNDKKLLLALTPLPGQRIDPQNKQPSQAKDGPVSNVNRGSSQAKEGPAPNKTRDSTRDGLRKRFETFKNKVEVIPKKPEKLSTPAAAQQTQEAEKQKVESTNTSPSDRLKNPFSTKLKKD